MVESQYFNPVDLTATIISWGEQALLWKIMENHYSMYS